MGSHSGVGGGGMCESIPGPSIRSSHKLRAFEQQKQVLSQTQRSEVQSPSVVVLCPPHLQGLWDGASTIPPSCRCALACVQSSASSHVSLLCCHTFLPGPSVTLTPQDSPEESCLNYTAKTLPPSKVTFVISTGSGICSLLSRGHA